MMADDEPQTREDAVAQGDEIQGEEIQGEEEQGEETPSLGESLAALTALFFSPARALEVLFTPSCPRFLPTLIVLYIAAPLVLEWRIWPEPQLGSCFLFLNHEYHYTPADYRLLAQFVRGFGLIVSLLIFVLVQHSALRVQKVSMPFLDTTALFVYSYFPPALIILISYSLWLQFDALFAALALAAIAVLFGVLCWYRGLYLLTELPERKIALTGVLVLLFPIVLVFAVAAMPLIVRSFPQSAPEVPASYLSDSIELNQQNKK